MKNMKKALSLVLALVMCLSMLPVSVLAAEPSTGWNGTAASDFAADENGNKGNGTDASPYLIETAEQLALMAEKIESSTTYRKASYKLVKDIDLYNAYKNWTPMGKTTSSAFSGKLIGNGHTISNLKVESNESKPMGLFGYTSGAEICNLTIKDAEVKHTGGAISNPNYDVYAAVLVGCAKANTKICNVHAVNATVSSGARAGGIVGVVYNGGTVCCSSIENTDVTVIGEYGNTVSFAGGIVGGNYFLQGTSKRAYINKCWTDADSTVTGKYAGGILGCGQSSSNAPYYTLQDCYNLASVTGSSQSAGIVSWARGYSTTDPIERCYNAGNISGTSSSAICAGIVCYGGNNYTGALKNCVNFGTITTSSNKSDAIAADNYAKTEPFSSNGCLYEVGSLVKNGVPSTSGMPRADILSTTTANTEYFGNSDVWTVSGSNLPTLKRCQGNDDCQCKCVPYVEPEQPQPALTITKSVTPTDDVKVGDWLTYTITVTNPESATKAAEDVKVTDVLPTGLDASTVKVGLGYTVTCDGQTLTWTVGELAAGMSRTLTFEVQTNAAGNIANTASVYKGGSTEPDATTPETGAQVTVAETTEEPSKPTIPEPKDLPAILGNGFVKVDCTNGQVNHADGTYGVLYQNHQAQGITIAEPVKGADDAWTCVVTVTAEPYVEKYNADTKVTHTTTDTAKTLTLTWDEDKWTADADANTVTFEVACTETAPAPVKPEPKDLPGILKVTGGFVKVDCTNEAVTHADRTYSLVYQGGEVQGITIADPVKGTNDIWTCVVTVEAGPYVAKYNKDVKDGHNLVDANTSPKTLTLTWVEDKWTADTAANTVTFEVACTETAPGPVKPEPKDLPGILKVTGGFVKVDCTNEAVTHADRTYSLVYQGGEVQGITIADPVKGTNDVWTCTVTVEAGPYVEKYNSVTTGTHQLAANEPTSKTLTLTWVEDKWTADANAKTVTFEVACTETAPGPVKPEPKDLPGILKVTGGFVTVDCTNNQVDHADRTYSLVYQDGEVQGITIADPVKGTNDVWTCVVTVKAGPYVAKYNKDVKDGHNLVDANTSPKTLTLTWVEDKWTVPVGAANTVTFEVTCDEKAPEPVKPKLQGILKAQINPNQLPDGTQLPDGMTKDSFVTVNGKLKFPEGAESVNVLYRITVIGEKGAKYTVTDEGAKWISGGETHTEGDTLTVTGTLASFKADIYVYKTFGKDAEITNIATLKPADDSTDPADGANDEDEISTEPVTTPVETETPDTRKDHDMSLKKLVNGNTSAEVEVGDKFTYTVVLDNTGKNPLYNLKITDTMVEGLELVDVSSAFLRKGSELTLLTAAIDADKRTSEWSVAEFGAGDEIVLVYQATATRETEDDATLDNNVRATAKMTQPQSGQKARLMTAESSDDITVVGSASVTVKPGGTNPPQPPVKPDAPASVSDINGDVSIKVRCTTTGSSHTEKSYELMDGGFAAGEVSGSETDGYTCEITINPGFYVARYDSNHWVDEEAAVNLSVTLTWNEETGKWDAPADAAVSIPAKCLLSQDAGNYTVEHYQEKLDGSYELAVTDTRSAKYGTVTAVPRSFEGFTYDENNENAVKSGEVSAGSEPVLKLYYTRNTYTVSYVYEGEVPEDVEVPDEETVKYGADVTVEDAPASENGTFNGWETADADVSDDHFTMPAHDVTFTGTWTVEKPEEPEAPKLTDEIVRGLLDGIEVNLVCDTDENHNKAQTTVKYSYTDNSDGTGTITISPRSYLSEMPEEPAHGLLDVDDTAIGVHYVEPAVGEANGHWELADDAPESITFRFLCVPEEEVCDHPVKDGHCAKEDCDHGPDCPVCHGPAPKTMFTVTYTDGVTGAEVFPNQVYTVENGAATPQFEGTPSREGYHFDGWEPMVADTVTDHAIYTAKWDHTDGDHADKDSDGKCDYCGKCMHNKDGEGYCTETDCQHDDGCCPKPGEKPVEKVYRLTINYIYTNGETASAAHTADLKAGEAYKVTSPSIADYTPSAAEISGTMGEGNETYTVVYSSNRTTPSEPSTPTPRPPKPDTDIKDENPPLANVDGLNAKDHFAYIAGYPDGTVRPMGNLTRAEAATIFYRLMEEEYRVANWSEENSFSDVNAGDWHNVAISVAAKAGILKGYEDGTFRPNQTITRAEFATMAVRFMTDDVSAEGVGYFEDTKDHWAAENIRLAVAAGWITGEAGGMFRPDEPITRVAVMELVNRMLDRLADADHMLDSMKTWPDNPASAPYYSIVQEATNGHKYTLEGTTETWTELFELDWVKKEAEWVANKGADAKSGEQ